MVWGWGLLCPLLGTMVGARPVGTSLEGKVAAEGWGQGRVLKAHEVSD